MEMTPQSTRSPNSPFRYISSHEPLYEYPSPAQSDLQYRSTDSINDLGLYSCSISASTVETVGSASQSTSAATNNWAAAALQHRGQPRSAHSPPNILSAEYDPFAPFHPAESTSYSHDAYSTQPAEVNILPASPLPSGTASQRSSLSSAPASEVFTRPGTMNDYTRRIKVEDHSDYAASGDPLIIRFPHLSHNLLVSSTTSYSGSLDATFYQGIPHLGWPKVEYNTAQDLPSISTLQIPSSDGRHHRGDVESPDTRRGNSTAARTRQPRKLTTKEDANFQCNVKGCGKLFSRSYNFKAHMETHDVSREYPFPCPLKDCNKKFVRKTDLQRHHQSVHMKQRNHRCDYCSRFFARKDTLRRHMEDGCSRRFDIETVDFKPQSYSNSDHNSMSGTSRSVSSQSRQPSYNSSAHCSPPPGNPPDQGQHESSVIPTSGPYLQRSEYTTGDGQNDSAWSS